MKPDVFILAAGLGTRLRPLTDTVPKPLIEVNSKPLIAYHLERLAKEGFSRVMINIHYLPDKIRDFVGSGSQWGLDISYSYEPVLLDTGGGVKNIQDWIRSDDLLIINSDSLFDQSLRFQTLVDLHLGDASVMTLLVGPGSNLYTPIYIDREQNLIGLGRDIIAPPESVVVTYLGVLMLSTKLLATMPPVGVPFSLISGIAPGVLSTGQKIRTVTFSNFWSDVGTPERLNEASKFFKLNILEKF